jgi:transglutaminase-like putative cysteine protease
VARYSIVHTTRQRYRETVHRSRNEVRLQPIDSASQRVRASEVEVTPTAEVATSLDYYSNSVWLIAVESPHRELVIEARSEVDVRPPLFEPIVGYPWESDSLSTHPAVEFTAPSPRVPRLKAIETLQQELGVRSHDPDSLMAANADLRQHFAYVSGATSVGTRLAEVLERRVGVCQDFAHVFLAVARQAGWPARYVSGYLVPDSSEARAESHAWVEVGTPEGRWVGLDPTHGLVVGAGHVRVAVGRDYDDVAPVRGTFAGQLPGEPPEVTVVIKSLVGSFEAVPDYAFADQ